MHRGHRGIWLVTILTLAASSIAVGGSASGVSGATPVTVPPKVVTRDLLTDGVTKTTVDTRTVQLSVNTTSNLRGLQQIEVSWKGAHPTGGSDFDPNSPRAARTDYPFVLLECRGVDSAAVPADQQVSPETCWTSHPTERSAEDRTTSLLGFPPWRLDMYAAPAQRRAYVGVDPQQIPGPCANLVAGSLAQYWLHFTASNGHLYDGGPNGCAAQPPEAVQNIGELSFPSNETFAVTGQDGQGSSKFVVHTSEQNASLGCSDSVACALVAIPIMGISCDVAALGLPVEDRAPTSTLLDPSDPTSAVPVAKNAGDACSASGHLVPGTVGTGGDETVSGAMWWAASNWRNRITVPLGFAPVGDPCSITGKSGGVDIYGSELMTEAALQWDPHFCGNDKLFTLKHVQLGEPSARNFLEKNLLNLKSSTDKLSPNSGVEAVFGSYAPTGTYRAPVVSAPVAISGFAISFAIDDGAGHEVTKLNLNARLLAKLLTESYASSLSLKNNYSTTVNGTTSTALRGNPQTIADDPEFQALNPGAPRRTTALEAGSTLYTVTSDSDVMYALTSYIINDPEAKAWLRGVPAPGGMVVNPHYAIASNEISLPTASWRQLDTYADVGQDIALGGLCPQFRQIPYLPLVAAGTSRLASIALAMQFAIPFSTTICYDVSNAGIGPYLFKRVGRQTPGFRFMLGVTSLGEANRYQLNTASLQTHNAQAPTDGVSLAGRTFTAPTDASLQAATKLLAPDAETQTWEIPADAIRSKPEGAGAYPGTMVVYNQVPTLGLPQIDASRYAQFLRFAATDGQTPGASFGQLPPGYLPMTEANGLGALVSYTKAAAAAVECQVGEVPPLLTAQVIPCSDQSPPPSQSPPSSSGSGSPSASAALGGQGASPTGTASTPPGGSSGSLGGTSGFGPSLSGGRNGAAPPPVEAPGGTTSGPLGVIGKTIGILSHAAGTVVLWLLYIAVGALAGAGVFWLVARQRGVKLGLKGLIAAIKEWLQRFVGRRAPH